MILNWLRFSWLSYTSQFMESSNSYELSNERLNKKGLVNEAPHFPFMCICCFTLLWTVSIISHSKIKLQLLRKFSFSLNDLLKLLNIFQNRKIFSFTYLKYCSSEFSINSVWVSGYVNEFINIFYLCLILLVFIFSHYSWKLQLLKFLLTRISCLITRIYNYIFRYNFI